MRRESVKDFYKYLKENENVKKELEENLRKYSFSDVKAEDQEAIILRETEKIAQKYNFDFTKDDLANYLKEVGKELTDEDLLNVAGGMSTTGIAMGFLMLTGISMGSGAVVNIVRSRNAASSGNDTSIVQMDKNYEDTDGDSDFTPTAEASDEEGDNVDGYIEQENEQNSVEMTKDAEKTAETNVAKPSLWQRIKNFFGIKNKNALPQEKVGAGKENEKTETKTEKLKKEVQLQEKRDEVQGRIGSINGMIDNLGTVKRGVDISDLGNSRDDIQKAIEEFKNAYKLDGDVKIGEDGKVTVGTTELEGIKTGDFENWKADLQKYSEETQTVNEWKEKIRAKIEEINDAIKNLKPVDKIKSSSEADAVREEAQHKVQFELVSDLRVDFIKAGNEALKDTKYYRDVKFEGGTRSNAKVTFGEDVLGTPDISGFDQWLDALKDKWVQLKIKEEKQEKLEKEAQLQAKINEVKEKIGSINGLIGGLAKVERGVDISALKNSRNDIQKAIEEFKNAYTSDNDVEIGADGKVTVGTTEIGNLETAKFENWKADLQEYSEETQDVNELKEKIRAEIAEMNDTISNLTPSIDQFDSIEKLEDARNLMRRYRLQASENLRELVQMWNKVLDATEYYRDVKFHWSYTDNEKVTFGEDVLGTINGADLKQWLNAGEAKIEKLRQEEKEAEEKQQKKEQERLEKEKQNLKTAWQAKIDEINSMIDELDEKDGKDILEIKLFEVDKQIDEFKNELSEARGDYVLQMDEKGNVTIALDAEQDETENIGGLQLNKLAELKDKADKMNDEGGQNNNDKKNEENKDEDNGGQDKKDGENKDEDKGDQNDKKDDQDKKDGENKDEDKSGQDDKKDEENKDEDNGGQDDKKDEENKDGQNNNNEETAKKIEDVKNQLNQLKAAHDKQGATGTKKKNLRNQMKKIAQENKALGFSFDQPDGQALQSITGPDGFKLEFKYQ